LLADGISTLDCPMVTRTRSDNPQAAWFDDDHDGEIAAAAFVAVCNDEGASEDEVKAALAALEAAWATASEKEPIDPGPVLGRKQAADWLEGRGQRREATRMRLAGSTQPRRAPIVLHAPQRGENVARPRERRARRASTSSRASPDDDHLPPASDPPLETWHGFEAASARLVVHLERRRAAMRLA
jgi:hypothetical protein